MIKILALAAGLLLANLVTHSAVAHSTISKSQPAEGAAVVAGLTEITLGFTQPVRVMIVKVRNMGAKIDVKADATPARTPAALFTFPVEPLQPGDHAVNWTAVAKDGHVMKGTLTFLVKK